MSDYIELHCHSNFSLLDGASPPEALAARAAALGMAALALTDHDNVYGAVRFAQAARAHGLKPIFGAEITLEPGEHLTLLVENQQGWRSLCRLITLARHNAPKGEAVLPPEALAGHTAGLIALAGCRQGRIAQAIRRHDQAAARAAALYFRGLFGPDRFWIELQNHLLPGDENLVRQQVEVAGQTGLGYAATNNVHYAERDDHRLQDVLVCIRHLTTLAESEHLRRPNSEYYLKDDRHMQPLFAAYPEALAHTRRIAERCEFTLQYGLQDLPPFPVPAGATPQQHLRASCERAIVTRYGDLPFESQARLDYELGVINRASLDNYFLIVWDIVRYARQHGIRCQGRGSAANSLVAYLLDITPIDPLAHDLVFERFLSDERQVTPDIDIDFDAARREDVIQYVYDRYGRDHAAMACTFITFRARSAVRDVGRALGFPPALIDRAAQALDTYNARDLAESASLRETLGEQLDGRQWAQLFDLCARIHRFPRHLGIHNGGMVITGSAITNYLADEPATMPGRTVVQWDKDSLEDAGLVKIDLLGLRMLSTISEAVETIAAATGHRPAIDRLRFDDPAVFARIRAADTIGLFQIESNAQTQLQPRLKAQTFEDLIISVSLIRPGPIQGDMVHPYLRRRAGLEPVVYPHPLLEPILAETLGVIIYQEQVLKVTHALTTLSVGQGEMLRRALGSDLDEPFIEQLRAPFVAGAWAKGVLKETANRVFDMLKAFGGYAFPKSHAAAFAVLVYQSAWLKLYHPAAFYLGLLNNQPMGFWSPAVLVHDAQRHGVDVLPVDVNHSEVRCTLENGGIRLGLRTVKGFGEVEAARMMDAREGRAFVNLRDLCQRSRLPPGKIENLILSGALDGWGPRRRLLWELGVTDYEPDTLPFALEDGEIELPPLSLAQEISLEHEILGLSPRQHTMSFYRPWLDEHGITDSRQVKQCRDGARVRVAGLIVMHQAPPTAKGMRFITLEDEYGLLGVIVRPNVYERFRRVVRGASALIVAGRVQREGTVVSVLMQSAREV